MAIALGTIKSATQTILETANTTTASPFDLSTSMTTRIQKVLQVNVEKIPIQPSFFPCITMFYDGKDVTNFDIAGSLLGGRRRAIVNLKIIGIVWIDNVNASNFQYKDLADNECEQLMENLEQVLRQDPTLGGNVLFSHTTDVRYHNYPVDEQTHLRTGIMTHKITVQY
jgi:hypothetical protein